MSERTRSAPGFRAIPEILNVSNSKPAAGTSRASARSGDPAKVTRTPRRRNASPTASAGVTCPAVPPAAIRQASCSFGSTIATDVKEDADGGERDHEARATIGDERERDARQRREPEDGGEVDCGLGADERDDSGRERLAERIGAAKRDSQAGVGEGNVGGDDPERADQAELLGDDGEDHVRVRLGEVEDLLDAVAEPGPEEPARSDPDHRLDRLVAGALRVAPGVEEAKDSRTPVRLEPGGGDAEHGDDRPGGKQRAGRRARDRKHPAEHEDERDRRTQVRLGEEQDAEDPDQEADRARELLERLRSATAPGQEPRRPDGERELRELGRLEDDRAERQPASGPVDRRAEHEDGEAEHEAQQHEQGRELLQRAEVDPGEDEEEDEPERRVHGLPLQVRVGITVRDRGRGRGRAVDHHEAERDERERDQDEDLDVERGALHASVSTSRRTESPRSSKLRNWS